MIHFHKIDYIEWKVDIFVFKFLNLVSKTNTYFLTQRRRDIEIKSIKALWKERNVFDRLVVSRGGGMGDKTGEGGQKVQSASYRISHGGVMYSSVTPVNNTVLHI